MMFKKVVKTVVGLSFVFSLSSAHAVTYICEATSQAGTLEAGEYFALNFNKYDVKVISNTLGECTGTAWGFEPMYAHLGGGACGADGFQLDFDSSALRGLSKETTVSVPTNDPSDVYSCLLVDSKQ